MAPSTISLWFRSVRSFFTVAVFSLLKSVLGLYELFLVLGHKYHLQSVGTVSGAVFYCVFLYGSEIQMFWHR